MTDIDALARLARARIAQELGGGPAPETESDPFQTQPGASFVTLRWNDGRLQGCIGSLEPRRPLADDVMHNALAAAFADPRASPLALEDLSDIRVEVSVLSPLEPIDFDGTEESARAALRVGHDGVVLVFDGQRGTFLPQMWEQLPTPREFLDELKRKAHLPTDFWSRDVKLFRYAVTKGSA